MLSATCLRTSGGHISAVGLSYLGAVPSAVGVSYITITGRTVVLIQIIGLL